MNNFEKMLNEFSGKGVAHPETSKSHTRDEAALLWNIHPKHVIWSDRIVSKHDPVWINDLDSRSVYAKETKKDLKRVPPAKD